MPRRPSLPSKNVNLRMPEDLLKQMDCLAQTRQHGRTSEINCACRYWIETSGHAKEDRAKEETVPDEKFETLNTAVKELENQIQGMHREIGEMMQQITYLTAELQKERTSMLGIMEQDKTIIGKLCTGMIEKLQETPSSVLTKEEIK